VLYFISETFNSKHLKLAGSFTFLKYQFIIKIVVIKLMHPNLKMELIF